MGSRLIGRSVRNVLKFNSCETGAWWGERYRSFTDTNGRCRGSGPSHRIAPAGLQARCERHREKARVRGSSPPSPRTYRRSHANCPFTSSTTCAPYGGTNAIASRAGVRCERKPRTYYDPRRAIILSCRRARTASRMRLPRAGTEQESEPAARRPEWCRGIVEEVRLQPPGFDQGARKTRGPLTDDGPDGNEPMARPGTSAQGENLFRRSDAARQGAKVGASPALLLEEFQCFSFDFGIVWLSRLDERPPGAEPAHSSRWCRVFRELRIHWPSGQSVRDRAFCNRSDSVTPSVTRASPRLPAGMRASSTRTNAVR